MKSHTINVIKGDKIKVCINDQTGNAALSIGSTVLSVSPSKQNSFIVGIKNQCEEFSILTMRGGGDWNLIDELIVRNLQDTESYGRCYTLVCSDKKVYSILSFDNIVKMTLIFAINLNKHFPALEIGKSFVFDEIDSKKFWGRIDKMEA